MLYRSRRDVEGTLTESSQQVVVSRQTICGFLDNIVGYDIFEIKFKKNYSKLFV